jgi:hypothetical protein
VFVAAAVPTDVATAANAETTMIAVMMVSAVCCQLLRKAAH